MQHKIFAQSRPSLVTPHVPHIDFGPDKSQYIISDDGEKLTIKLGNKHGVADGKQLHTFLLSTLTNPKLKAQLQGVKTLYIEVGKGNPQFVYFYTLFPPGMPPFPMPNAQINVYYKGAEKPLEIFHTLTTSDARGIDFFPNWMGKDSNALVSEGEKYKLQTYLTQMKARFKGENFSPLQPNIDTTFKALSIKIEERVSELKKGEEPFIAGCDIGIKASLSVLSRVTLLAVDDASSGVVRQSSSESLYVETDQLTHIFTGHNTRFVVDDGHPKTKDYLLNHDKEKNVFMVTHFHDDHVINLAEDIELSCEKKQTHLVIHEGCEQQFIGYLLSHPNLVALIETGKLTFEVLKKESEGLEIDNQVILPYVSSDKLKHFIHSAGFVVYDKNKNKIRFYTGDINPQLTDKTQEFKAAFIEDCKRILTIAKEKGASQVDIYYDQGHFPEGTMLKDVIKRQLTFAGIEFGIFELNLFPEHCKDATGVGGIQSAVI